MIKIHHINCGTLQKDNGPLAICHCMLLENKEDLTLVDTGIGVLDVLHPFERIGKELIELAGFKFNMEDTAVSQIRKLGFKPEQVRNIIISHLDPDHIGGLADFPDAQVHVSATEYECFKSGHPRYLAIQMSHNPILHTYSEFNDTWFGLKAHKITLNPEMEVYLVSLPGHTLGHCGVAINQNDNWIFYIADTYYLRDELFVENHLVSELSKLNAMDNPLRLKTLNSLIQLLKNLKNEIKMFGYHDPTEFPN